MFRNTIRIAACLTFLTLVFTTLLGTAGVPARAAAADSHARTQEVVASTLSQNPAQAGNIAYVYRGNTADATSFSTLLTTNGYSVDLVPLGDVLSTDFSKYDLTIIADDSGDLNQWGLPGLSANQVAQITRPNKPILGLGEGGYAFFGQLSLFIGWPNGWHGPQDSAVRNPGAPIGYFSSLGTPPGGTVKVYNEPVNAVGIYLNPPPLPTDVVPFGLEPASRDHSPLIIQNCRQLWGYSGNPNAMTADGKQLFLGNVAYARDFQCPPQEPPPDACIRVEKSAVPPAGTPVSPGDVIAYTITYLFSNSPNCENPERAKLVDSIPLDTIYVPGSASNGITPTADGALVWDITPAAGSQTKTFRVRVSDTQCRNQRTVNNRAGIVLPGAPPVISNVVSHPVECPPITLPNDEPPYAESEVQITPYPLVTGTPSEISVRISNSSSQPQPVKVSFQTSPQRFGIGLNYNTFDSTIVTIPANSNLIVKSSFTPVSSGHYCIQIKIEDASARPKYQPVTTQRNIDVTEDLTPGQPDSLTFKVANPTASTANINLVVVNTCPGWTATVSPPTLINVGPNGSDVRNATLTVTPPNPATLGSGCHIDVQGWIGDRLIGGIRKLDVPPVHLPPDVQPPWKEPEISVIPDPPVVGQPAQICVELQNPLNVAKTVTVEFAVADFGAGIGFTPVGTQNFTLPPNSLNTYCINWTPTAGGTLHRCILVTLKQPGYQDMRSQRNVNLVGLLPGQLPELDIPLLVRNPDGVPHKLELVPTLYGIKPFWTVALVRENGDPPPEILGANQQLNLRLRCRPQSLQALANSNPAQTPPADYGFGDESRVDVAVLLDGLEIGGVSVVLETDRQYLPIIVQR